MEAHETEPSPSCDVWPRCVPNSHALAIAASLTSEQDTAEFCSRKRHGPLVLKLTHLALSPQKSARHVKAFRKEETSSITAAVQGEHVRHEYSDRIIVSARVEGYRRDAWLGLGLNGDWRPIEGGIGQSFVEVEFTTPHWRSGGSLLEVWTVPWALYAEGQV
jgi:hypothetical protein